MGVGYDVIPNGKHVCMHNVENIRIYGIDISIGVTNWGFVREKRYISSELCLLGFQVLWYKKITIILIIIEYKLIHNITCLIFPSKADFPLFSFKIKYCLLAIHKPKI